MWRLKRPPGGRTNGVSGIACPRTRQISCTGMTATQPPKADDIRFDNLLDVVGGEDDLLDTAINRLRAEEVGEATNWFKHGEHGSHNSFIG